MSFYFSLSIISGTPFCKVFRMRYIFNLGAFQKVAKFFIPVPLSNICKLQLIMVCLTFCFGFLGCMISQLPKRIWKGWSKKTWLRLLLLDSSGKALALRYTKISTLMHYSFLAVSERLNGGAAGKPKPWAECQDDCICMCPLQFLHSLLGSNRFSLLAQSTWLVHPMHRSKRRQPRTHCRYWILCNRMIGQMFYMAVATPWEQHFWFQTLNWNLWHHFWHFKKYAVVDYPFKFKQFLDWFAHSWWR